MTKTEEEKHGSQKKAAPAERGKQASIGMQRKVEEGWFAGPAPLGYRNVRDQRGAYIEVDEEVAPLIQQAFCLLTLKKMSLRKALRLLTLQGLRTKKGKPLTYSSFQLLVTNPFYCGMLRYNGQLTKGRHRPLVSAELFQQAQDRVRERQKCSRLAVDAPTLTWRQRNQELHLDQR